MSTARTLYVAISAHGYGHIGQTAPVVSEVYERIRNLRVVIECAAPREILARRFSMPFHHVPVSTDFGMVMKNAFEADVAASHARYLEMHKDIDRHIEAAARRLTEHRADLLLANIPYVPIAAARRLDLPILAMCSLNWSAIYQPLCEGMPGADAVHREMISAYQSANAFIALEPGMDMPALVNVQAVGPVAAVRPPHRDELFAMLGLDEGERLVMVSMGGIATELPLDRWPRIDGVSWIMPDGGHIARDDMFTHSAIGRPFLDLLASSDALITKPGYGAFVEAACNGVPVLYVPRVGWPEAPFLTRWLGTHGRCLELERSDLITSRLDDRLQAVWHLPDRPRVPASGVRQAANIIERHLSVSRVG